MHTEPLFIIILAFWVFVLQSKIKHLEKIVYGLKEKYREPLPKREAMVEKEMSTPIQQKVDEVVIQESFEMSEPVEETLSEVERFKERHYEPPKTQVHTEPSVLATWITNYFTGGNLLVRIGGVVLFFGLAFLVKYATEHSIISMQMRLWGIAVAAIGLIVTGWRLRDREGAYGQVLQGLGVAMLYLVIYGASKFYGLLSLESAFVLMLLVVIIGSVLAVIEDALPLALFATAGGFLVPILTSSGDGSHVMLFTYYVFLNLGIFIVAWYRSWRVLNVLGFVFTFVIATVWGVLRYHSGMFESTEPFLLIFFAMYLAISILFTIKHPYEPKNLVDGTLTFGLPVVVFPLQVSLVHLFEYGEAISAVVLGLVYAGLYTLLKNKERTGLLAQSFLALSVVFFTIAVPYIFDADVSVALWSLESAAIIWVSLKQNKVIARYFGIFLLLVSVVVYPESVRWSGMTLVEYLGFLIVMTSTMIAAWLLDTHREMLHRFTHYFIYLFLVLSLMLWFMSTPSQLTYFADDAYMLTAIIGAVLCVGVVYILKWRLLSVSLQGFLFLGGFLFYASKNMGFHFYATHPFEGFGLWMFIGLVAVQYLLLSLYDKVWTYVKALHLLTLWFVVSVLTFEVHYHVVQLHAGESMTLISWAIVALIFTVLLLKFSKYLGKYQKTYFDIGAGGLLLFLALWEVRAFMVPADFLGMVYFPLFNPIDLMQIAVLMLLGYWTFKQSTSWSKEGMVQLYGVLAGLTWVLLTVIFARYVHASQEIAYTAIALWHSSYFQTGISLLWSGVAILSMILSKVFTQRILWLGGFGLLIFVVLKLFFVELANSGTIERIVSFIVVGVLLLLIGYFVPMPPEEKKRAVKKK